MPGLPTENITLSPFSIFTPQTGQTWMLGFDIGIFSINNDLVQDSRFRLEKKSKLLQVIKHYLIVCLWFAFPHLNMIEEL